MNKLNSYLQLIRFYNPIGFWLLLWPGFWGLFIHPGFEISHFVIVLLGSFLTRSLGCAINDFLDKDIDGKVFRTKDRPIAAGLITKFEAKIFIILLSVICLFLDFEDQIEEEQFIQDYDLLDPYSNVIFVNSRLEIINTYRQKITYNGDRMETILLPIIDWQKNNNFLRQEIL